MTQQPLGGEKLKFDGVGPSSCCDIDELSGARFGSIMVYADFGNDVGLVRLSNSSVADAHFLCIGWIMLETLLLSVKCWLPAEHRLRHRKIQR